MTSMWRTCFRSLAILSLASLPTAAAAETVKGVLALNAAGDARPAKKLDASGVVVWLEPATPAGQAAVAIGRHAFLAAALLLQLKTVLDNADGQLARMTGRVTELGRYLDSESDLLVDAAIFAALGIWIGAPLALAGFLLLTAVLSRVTQRVSVGTSPVVVPETQLVVSTEPLPPHKDKYGRDYATKTEERVFYQGARR